MVGVEDGDTPCCLLSLLAPLRALQLPLPLPTASDVPGVCALQSARLVTVAAMEAGPMLFLRLWIPLKQLFTVEDSFDVVSAL